MMSRDKRGLFYGNNFGNIDDFIEQIDMLQNKGSVSTEVVKLYYSTNDINDRDKTVKLAFRIYKQHLRVIDKYTSLYVNFIRKFHEIRNMGFDDEFYKNDYKFIDVSFDIFLSHRYYLRFYNIIVFYILTVHFDLIVYVDWIFDYNVNPIKLSEETVKLLKYRMNQSKKLLVFNILNSNITNWIVWEVGYFSCLRENSISIFDLDGYCTGNKNVEVLSSNDIIQYDSKMGLFFKK